MSIVAHAYRLVQGVSNGYSSYLRPEQDVKRLFL